MRIANFRIENYKSFRATEGISFTPGFNVIVGPNNAGKTAFVEALSLQFPGNPCRNRQTVQYVGATLGQPNSDIHISFVLSEDEFINLLKDLGEFYVPVRDLGSNDLLASEFIQKLQMNEPIIIDATYRLGIGIIGSYSKRYENPQNPESRVLHLRMERNDKVPKVVTSGRMAIQDSFLFKIAAILSQRIYFFRAERLNIGEAELGGKPLLLPNAANLPQVLHYLQTSNPPRFDKFTQLVNRVFPEIRQITVPPNQDQLPLRGRILIWTHDPATEREDLAIALAESGTGIGQVLAILYIVVTSDYPRTIVIDEPQSFLHPGAIRKLFEILQREHPQHQYIVTTHSPTVITAANPEILLRVSKKEGESGVEAINMKETLQLRYFLDDIGARLSDVFGADNILWVEGRTEEQCFLLIFSRIVQRPLLGTTILGVINTGDFEKKSAKLTLEIYNRLSRGQGLLPPAVGFIFDREGRTKSERQDLIRQSHGAMHFLLRRMYENYLLKPQAIAAVMSGIDRFREQPISAEEITKWLQGNKWSQKYFERTVEEREKNEEVWITKVHAAKVLEDLFSEFSDDRHPYNKVEHGLLLTNWLIDHCPNELEEIANLLKDVLPPPSS